jgi:hypothetical protein
MVSTLRVLLGARKNMSRTTGRRDADSRRRRPARAITLAPGFALACGLFLLLSPAAVRSQHTTSIDLEWDRNSEPDLGGYVLMVGPSPGTPTVQIDTRLTPTAKVPAPTERPQFAWVHAYNAARALSPPSNVILLPMGALPDGGTGGPESPGLYPAGLSPEDPDEDGLDNLAEWQRGTDALLPNRRYFSIGPTTLFDSHLALVNAGEVAASGTVRFRHPEGEERIGFSVPPRARATILVNQVLGAASPSALWAIVEVERGGLVAERTARWRNASSGELVAGYTSGGLTQPSLAWYFADADLGRYQNIVLLANENDRAAQVTIDFFDGKGGQLARSFVLAPRSHVSIDLGRLSGLSGRQWIRVQASVAVLAERVKYLVRGGAWQGGDITAGVAAPSNTWYFADGESGVETTWLTVANPIEATADVEITWLPVSAAPVVQRHSLRPRESVSIEASEAGLMGTSMAALVRSTVPVIAERTISWPGDERNWVELHALAGSPSLGRRWVLAEGEVGGAHDVGTYVTIVNPGRAAAMTTVTALRENGPPLSTTLEVSASSRVTVGFLSQAIGQGQRFGLDVTSSHPVAVERSMSWSAGGSDTRGGTTGAGYRVW